MDINDIFTMMFYDNAVKITEPAMLGNLRNLLEDNFDENAFFLNERDPLECAVKETLFEEAVCDEFNEAIIRKAFELGYYPMSIRKRITKRSEIKHTELPMEFINELAGKELYRNFLTMKYHSNKLIIQFENLHITKKLKGWLNGKFADYTITFNKNFDLCIYELLKAYPETWLTPDLVEQYRNIHKNPDSRVSVDSVEIWHNGKLVAGEIGFITHNAYASLSGFHNEDDIGTAQMCVLGLFLKNHGFAYWDLGMELEYKYRYGAASCSRDEQESLFATLSENKLTFPKDEIKLKDFLELL